MTVLHRGGDRLDFRCPGCGEVHSFYTSSDGGRPSWSWNGDMDRPTFSPSLLVRSGHYARHHKAGDECWCTMAAEAKARGEPAPDFACYVCHSFVRDGSIRFLGDCTHTLAGQTVPLPPFEVAP